MTTRVGMVLADRDFPPDIRVEKEARSLIKAGYEVHLLCPLMQDGRNSHDDVEGVQVHRTPLPENLKSIPDKVDYYLRGVHRNWLQAIRVFAEAHGVDILHVHDLPYVLTAARVARQLSIPVIFDMHGDLPAAAETWWPKSQPKGVSLKRRIFDLAFGNEVARLRRMERMALEQATHIIVVVDESKERLMKIGIPKDKVTVVMNVEDVEYFGRLPIDESIAEKFNGKFVVSYIGGMEGVRGLENLIAAFPYVLDRAPEAILLLVGDGHKRGELERLTGQLEIDDQVLFTGWVDFSLVPTYISVSTVCVIPHLNNAHTDTTIPHKLFQYMLMGKPVVATNARPIRRIVEETGCGTIVDRNVPEAMAEAILKVAEPSLAQRLGENGRQAVLENYNWENEAKKLIQVYSSLCSVKEA